MKNIHKYISFSIVIYIAGAIFGFVISNNKNTNSQIDNLFFESSRTTFHYFSTISRIDLMLHILRANLVVILINFFGAFSFGSLSILNSFYNGVVLAYSLNSIGKQYGYLYSVAHFLPHSTESLAIIFSCAMGMYSGLFLLRSTIFETKTKFKIKQVSIFSVLSIILITISAFFEAYISF